MKPKILIVSSTESLETATAIQTGLESCAECTIWNQNVFLPGRHPLDTLLGALQEADFGVFVFAPDDVVISRNEARPATRDNVVLELGLFIGRLGRERCFVVAPRGKDELMPSDLKGLIYADYDADRANLDAALGPACGKIRKAIQDVLTSKDTQYSDPARWTVAFPPGSPVEKLFLKTASHSERDLLERIAAARVRLNSFGVTRNFFVDEKVRGLIERKACEIPINIFMMDPNCKSREDRYRLEPTQAAFEDPQRFERLILRPYRELRRAVRASSPRPGAGLQVYFFNFPCSHSIEEFDGDACRVMFYGHGKRGTDSPLFVFRSGTPYFDFFISQMRWLETLAQGKAVEPWKSADLRVWPLPEAD